MSINQEEHFDFNEWALGAAWEDETPELIYEPEPSDIDQEMEKNDAFASQLEEQIENDAGYLGHDEVINHMARIYIRDKSNWMRILKTLKNKHMVRVVMKSVMPEVYRIGGHGAGASGRANPSDLPLVSAALGEQPPVHPSCVVPEQWVMHPAEPGKYSIAQKIVKRSGEDVSTYHEPVCYIPVVVTRRLVDIQTRLTHYEIAWKGKRWHRRVIARGKSKEGRELIRAMADYGFPADQNNAARLVQYLGDYENANMAWIPKSLMTSQMGWQDNLERGFVMPHAHPRGDDIPEIHYEPRGPGDEQIKRALTPKGSMDEWCRAAATMADYPSVILAVYAALAPPILEILKASNFVLDWSDKTSSGKTTTLTLAASVWGNPDDKSRDSFLVSWDTTQVGIEQRAASLNALPLIVDDTKRAKRTRDGTIIPSTIYEICNGQGRQRGGLSGAQGALFWRTVMLTTGEQNICDYDKSGGVPARVISLAGNPFGGNSDEAAEKITQLRWAIRANHGLAGPAFVAWLVRNLHKAKLWQEQHQALTAKYIRLLGREAPAGPTDRGVLGRRAEYMATLEMAARLAHEALPLPWAFNESVARLSGLAAEGSSAADREVEAMAHIVSVSLANREKFSTGSALQEEPAGGWLGAWENLFTWQKCCWLPHAIEKELQRAGYEPKSIFRQWRERGWLVSDSEGRYTSKVYAFDGRPRMVVIARGAFVDCGATDEEIP